MKVVLAAFCLLFLFLGIDVIFIDDATIMHEIMGTLLILCSAVCGSGVAIIDATERCTRNIIQAIREEK